MRQASASYPLAAQNARKACAPLDVFGFMSGEAVGAAKRQTVGSLLQHGTSRRPIAPHDALAFVFQLCGTAPTLEDTLRVVCAASPLWSRVPYFLHFSEELALVGSKLPRDEDHARVVALWLRLLGRVTGAPVVPRALYVMAPDLSLLSVPDSCRVHVAHPWFGVALTRVDLRRKNPTADARLYELLCEYAEARLCTLGQVRSTSQVLHHALRKLDDLALAKAAPMARSLGMGVRTLQEQLRAEGSSYRRVLEQLRMQRCLARIRAGDVEPSALSHALGFADEASFHRAFKRWTGLTVVKYIAQHVAPVSQPVASA